MPLTRAAEGRLGEIKLITASIHRGEGTLGKLIRDDTLHQNLTDLSHQSERTLTALEDNLAALKETWPLSRYFDRRAYADRERAVLPAGLVAQQPVPRHGRPVRIRPRALDPRGAGPPGREIACWKPVCRPPELPDRDCRLYRRPERSRARAEILTQEQADSVRKYLVDKHAVQSAGWFRSRKVAAVGFGTHVPPTQDPLPPGSPPRRIEIILFTPQT